MKKPMGKYWKWVPFNAVFSYVIATLFVSFFGPIKYAGFEKTLTAMYVALFLIASWLSAYIAIKKGGLNKSPVVDNDHVERRGKLIALLAIFLLGEKALLLLSSVHLFGMPKFENVINSFAVTYGLKSVGEFAAENVYRQIDTLSTVVYYGLVSYVFFFRRTCGNFVKIATFSSVFITFLYAIFYLGDQKPFFDVIVLVFSAYVAERASNGKPLFDTKTQVLYIGSLLVLILFFSSVMSSRLANFGYGQSLYISATTSIDYDNFMLWLVPKDYKHQLAYFLIYPTMGWYGLSLTLKLPFEWTYGLGAFRGINSYLSQFFDIPSFYEKTYLGRMADVFGYDGLANWNTIFPWLASDFTFIGAVIYMALMMYIYVRSWLYTVTYKNPISLLMFSNLNVMFLYITANNQIFHQRGSAVTTLLIFVIWFAYNKKFNRQVCSC